MGGRGSSSSRTSRKANSKDNENAIFKPTKVDDLSKKLMSGDYIKVSKSSITVKDDNDKTRGVVRGTEFFFEVPAREQFEINSEWRKATRQAGREPDGIKIDRHNLFRHNKKLYLLYNPNSDRRALQAGTGDRTIIRKKSDYLSALEKAGITIVSAEIKKSGR